jgi:hypothetical protein
LVIVIKLISIPTAGKVVDYKRLIYVRAVLGSNGAGAGNKTPAIQSAAIADDNIAIIFNFAVPA